MANLTIDGALRVIGQLLPNSIVYPLSGIFDAAISSLANIDAGKMRHQHAIHYEQALGADVVAESKVVHVVHGTPSDPAESVISGVNVVASSAPTGGDKVLTVDIQVGNESTGYSTVLSAPIAYGQAQVNREVVAGVISAGQIAQGDSILVVVATSGSSGSQAQGLNVTITDREGPSAV